MKIFMKGLHGCGMRKTDIQQYQDFFVANGHELCTYPEDSDAILLWTCAFRGDFRDNSLSEIRSYMSHYDGELIVVGCLPDIDRDLLQSEFQGRFINWKNDDEQIERLFGSGKKKLSEIPKRLGEKPVASDLEQFKKDHPNQDVQFVDQFIKLFIQEGCRFKCTYCSEILAFPKYQSFPEAQILEECKDLVRCTGSFQVMLLGDSISDYGCDIGTNLPSLIEKICAIDPKIKIALQGYNPTGFFKFIKEMASFIDHGKIRHMQLPIQSASERMLRLMNRPYTRAVIDRVFSLLNEKKFTEIDTHIIVGFPGETDEDLEETVRFILRHRPKYVLASRYMESPQMPSAALPDKIDPAVARERLLKIANRIRAAGILCNWDESELSEARFRTMNYVPIKKGSL